MTARSSPGGFVVAIVTNPGSFMATIMHPTGNGYCRDRILRDTRTTYRSFEVKILQQFYPMDENVATKFRRETILRCKKSFYPTKNYPTSEYHRICRYDHNITPWTLPNKYTQPPKGVFRPYFLGLESVVL